MFIRDNAATLSHEVTPEGFLRLRARIGRTGIHEYDAQELGLPTGFGPGDSIRVYRPPAEVFDPASMASFAAKPVTDDHPPAMIDATNWRRYAIGHSGESVAQDGDHLAADLFIADAAAAERAQRGTELSNGYHADFLFEPGMTPEGEPYHAVQRNIRGNHIALVDAGRCGSSCRVDGQGGSDVAGADMARAQRTAQGTTDAPASQCGCRDAEGAPDLDALVAERAATIDVARHILGPAFDATGRATPAIRRLVVGRRLGEAAILDRSDAYVAAAFDTLGALQARANPLAAHLAVGLADAAGGRDAALTARDRFLSTAWQGDQRHGDL